MDFVIWDGLLKVVHVVFSLFLKCQRMLKGLEGGYPLLVFVADDAVVVRLLCVVMI